MPVRSDVLFTPHFWTLIASTGIGCVGGIGCSRTEPPDIRNICSLFGVDAKSFEEWSNQFTGWYPGIFDDGDGYLEDPAIVRVPLVLGTDLLVEFHAGDFNWLLARGDGPMPILLGNVGPHWNQPGLRLQEAIAIADSARNAAPTVLPLLLPIVWLTRDDDVEAARSAVRDAWLQNGFSGMLGATALADAWVQSRAGGQQYQWWLKPDVGWVTNSEWSTRFEQRDAGELLELNRAIANACIIPDER